MTNKDLTVIYYTANLIDEQFAFNQRRLLASAIGDLPLISLSKKPLNFGINICEGNTERSIINIYRALLVGTRAAKTKYVALAEDDTLYPDEHFSSYLPPEDTFAYNMTRWNIFTWSKPPFFSLAHRKILATLIAPRQLLIDAIEERFVKYPDANKIPLKWMGEPGRQNYEMKLGVMPRKSEEFYTYNPIVVFSHPAALGYRVQGKRKGTGRIRAIELPYWGRAGDILNLYKP